MSGIWIDRDIEILLRNKLDTAFGNDTSRADLIYSDYTLARKKAIEIASQINRVENNLTDHSPEHIANVLDNTYKLIDGYIEDLNYAEIYFLCLIIQFHDIGNINGRKGHQTKIAEIYNSVRGTGSEYRSERDRLFRAVSAHCGEINGDRDTLKKLNESSDLLGMPLRLKELAAILRFADELAEGPQRTSDYIIEKDIIEKNSKIYHAYAKVTNVYIDASRISISYHIDLDDEHVTTVKFEDLLSYIYTRIIKLDEERRYCKYYSPILGRYKKTQVTFNITRGGFPIEVDIPEIQLSDKFNLNAVDDGSIYNLLKEYPQLDIARIIESISKITA